jgi:hypothetical protein
MVGCLPCASEPRRSQSPIGCASGLQGRPHSGDRQGQCKQPLRRGSASALRRGTDAARLAARTREADLARDDAERATEAEMQRQVDELQAEVTQRGLVLTLGDVWFGSNSAELQGGASSGVSRWLAVRVCTIDIRIFRQCQKPLRLPIIQHRRLVNLSITCTLPYLALYRGAR